MSAPLQIVAEIPMVMGGVRTIAVEDGGTVHVTTTSPLLDEADGSASLSISGAAVVRLAQDVLAGKTTVAPGEPAHLLAAAVLVLLSGRT